MEKLKLKDAIDKFLKEGEYELIDENLIGENAKEIIINMVKDAFQKGAEWMHEKAVQRFANEVSEFDTLLCFIDKTSAGLIDKENTVEMFRKTMEE